MEYQYESYGTLPAWFWIVMVGIVVMMLASWWRIFEKAGQPGWAALIPIYNIYIMTKVAGKPGWWVLMFIIPLVNYVFIIWLWNMVSKSFGKDEGYTTGLVLLGIVFWPILAFSSAKYLGPYGDPAQFAAYQEKNKFEFEEQAN